MNVDQQSVIKSLLIKRGYKESGITKGWFFTEDGSDRAADLRKAKPIIGILISGNIVTEGHGNLKILDDIQEVEAIMRAGHISGNEGVLKSDTPDTPDTSKKGTTTAICERCKLQFNVTNVDQAQKIIEQYGKLFCLKCQSSPPTMDSKIELPKNNAKPDSRIVTKNCKSCGLELSGARALYCYQKEKPFTCEDCYEKEYKETEKGKDATIEKREARPEESKIIRQPDARIPIQTHTQQGGSIIKGFQPSLKEIGKIKIGSKGEEKPKAGGGTFRLPVKFDHFEIVSLVRNEKGDFIKDPVMQLLGENPKELDIMLLFNEPTLNFITRYNQYQGGKCLCQGDGATAKQIDGAQVECNPDTCPQFAQKKCKPNGILSVILTKSPRLGGVYKFRTTSFNSIRSILSSLFFLSNLTGGVLAMIPLKLTVSPMQVQPKDSAKPQTIFVVNIEFSGTAPELLQKTFEVHTYQKDMREHIIKLESTARAALTAPESKEEINEIEAEFYPKQEK